MKDHHSLLRLITIICISVLVREQEMWMAGCTLLFIVVLTIVSKVMSLQCSDQQQPASGNDGLQQATTAWLMTAPSRGSTLERNWTLRTLLIVSLLLPQQMATPL